jgi:hypothetical protein
MASDGILLPLIREHGPPPFYIDHIRKNGSAFFGDSPCKDLSPTTNGDKSFATLCRIVSGQQLAGGAALTIWRRLLRVVGATADDTSNLSPDRVLSIAEDGDAESELRAPAGLSNAKCNCIIAIARCFRDGTLSDDVLLGRGATDDEVKSRLKAVKGVGPWTVRVLKFTNFGGGFISLNNKLNLLRPHRNLLGGYVPPVQ